MEGKRKKKKKNQKNSSTIDADKAWTSFFLLYETTDDFALHLIQDAWQQLEVLFDAGGIVHPSWLSVVLDRLIRHASSSLHFYFFFFLSLKLLVGQT